MSSTEIIFSIVISVLVLFGSFLIFAGVLGVIRLPDVFCRMHAATKGPTLGIMLIMLGSIIFFATAGGHEGSFYSRNILIILFILFTNPVGAHMLSKNAYKSGVPMWKKSVRDDWKDRP